MEVWRAQMMVLRGMTPVQRHQSWFEFQCDIDEIAISAIRQKFPDRSERFHLAEFVRRAHGADLARDAFPDIEFDR